MQLKRRDREGYGGQGQGEQHMVRRDVRLTHNIHQLSFSVKSSVSSTVKIKNKIN